MNKTNKIGLAVMAVAAVAVVALADPAYSALTKKTAAAGGDAAAGGGTVLTGEADGFGGPIKAEVTLGADGKIADLKLTGDGETEGIGAAALDPLKTAILEKKGLDGVDAVAGATITSNGVFAAVKAAMGE